MATPKPRYDAVPLHPLTIGVNLHPRRVNDKLITMLELVKADNIGIPLPLK